MTITEKKVTIKEFTKNYTDDNVWGVYAYDGKLVVRPPYQREFIYDSRRRDLVIDSVSKKLPISVMYWADNGDGTYEVIDGQQRTISICQYINGDFSLAGKLYHNMKDGETKDTIDNYEIIVEICKGTDEEKLEWFRRINVAGERLTEQELLNATYYGTWLSDAKKYFPKLMELLN